MQVHVSRVQSQICRARRVEALKAHAYIASIKVKSSQIPAKTIGTVVHWSPSLWNL